MSTSETIDDGGPASEKSLLDEFAGQAMIGILSNPGFRADTELAHLAQMSYISSIAMLNERERILSGKGQA